MKALGQLLILVVVFLLSWWGLSHVPWVKKFKIDQFTKERREQLSNLLLEMHRMDKTEIEDDSIVQPVIDLKGKLCKAKRINGNIRIHIFQDDQVNAFALPGG